MDEILERGSDDMPKSSYNESEAESPIELGYDEPSEIMDEADMLVDSRPLREALNDSSSLRSINIEPLSSGYVVKVGCQTVAVETSEKLVKMLGIYLENPSEFEKKWYSKDVRNRLENIK